MTKKILSILKLVFLAVITFLLFSLVDLSNLEFKSRTNYPRTNDEGPLAGIIRNEELPGELDQEFSGNIDDIIDLVNSAREAEGKSALKKNETLCRSAELKALDMKEKSYFDHTTPEGLQFWFFVEKAGYKYKATGENLAEGYFSAIEVHDAWMDSEGHRKNILSDDFEEIGVAVVPIESNGMRSYLAVQHFGTPLRQEDLQTRTVCDLKSRRYCESAEERLDEVRDTIKTQKKIIKDAKEEGAKKKELAEAQENLDKLEEIEDDLEDYLKQCQSFIDSCDSWQ